MGKPQSNFKFRGMAFFFWIRDLFSPPEKILKELNIINTDAKILDYGCGLGSYTIAAAKLVGQHGKVYAVDIHPLAIKMVERTTKKKGLHNIETILSDCQTNLPSESLDVVLFYDTLHALSEPTKILEELHRVLKFEGILSISEHHYKEKRILDEITANGLFELMNKKGIIYNFKKK